MAVVINELEVTSTPPSKASSGPAQSATQPGSAQLTSDMAREIEKTLHKKHERLHRLNAC